jgi:hypothetical protein
VVGESVGEGKRRDTRRKRRLLTRFSSTETTLGQRSSAALETHGRGEARIHANESGAKGQEEQEQEHQ